MDEVLAWFQHCEKCSTPIDVNHKRHVSLVTQILVSSVSLKFASMCMKFLYGDEFLCDDTVRREVKSTERIQ